MNLHFVPAEEADLEILFELNKSLITQYEDPSSIDLDEVLAWIKRKLQKKLSEYRAVILDDEKVGYFRLCGIEDNTLELDDLYVLAPYRRQGIATGILRYCISESERRHKPLMLYVFTQNLPALLLYEKMGFEVQEIASPTRQIMIRCPAQSQH